MKSNFASKIHGMKPDIRREYDKLYEIYTEEFIKDYQGRTFSFEIIFAEHFTEFHFAGTCLSLDEFYDRCGYRFEEEPKVFDVDYFISFAECFYNMLVWLPPKFYGFYHFFLYDNSFVQQHILNVIEAIGYISIYEDEFTIFVPKDNVAMAVSESVLIPEDVSQGVVSYKHYSMKGNVENKKQTLLVFADFLEPKRKELEKIDKQFTSDLFYAFNNFNIRHNNLDPAGPKYKKPVGELSKEQLEKLYDNVYQMCLLAFMRLDYVGSKTEFDKLKNEIEGK